MYIKKARPFHPRSAVTINCPLVTCMTPQEGTNSVSIAAAIDLIQQCLADNILTHQDLDQLNIPLNKLTEVTDRIPETDFIALWQKVAQHKESQDIGLRVGQIINPNAKGLLASWISQASSLKEALNIFIEHIPLMNASEHWLLSESENTCALTFSFTQDKGYPNLAIERSISSIIAWAELLSGKKIEILKADFTFPTPLNLETFNSIFGPNITFNCQKNCLIFHNTTLAMPIISSNYLLKDIIKSKAKLALQDLNSATSIYKKVSLLLKELINNQQPISVTIISDSLNMSRQTLYRELKEHNTDFKSLFDLTRKEQAAILLRSNSESIDTISIKLGYKDNSSFYKAFKRWYGQPPALYRRKFKNNDSIST